MYKLQREVTLKERLSRFKSSEKFILISFSAKKRREVRMRSHAMMTMTALRVQTDAVCSQDHSKNMTVSCADDQAL